MCGILRLRYGAHVLALGGDVLPLLVDGRRAVLAAAVSASGAAKTINVPPSFPAAPTGAYEHILERAYFLWKNQAGSRWWDPVSNWVEAERGDAAADGPAGSQVVDGNLPASVYVLRNSALGIRR